MRERYDTSGPGKFETEPPFARFLYENFSPQDFDEDAASEGMGWIGRIGRRILAEDSVGFVGYRRYATEAEAIAAYEAVYGDYVYDDDDYDEDDDEEDDEVDP